MKLRYSLVFDRALYKFMLIIIIDLFDVTSREMLKLCCLFDVTSREMLKFCCLLMLQ